MARTTRQTQLDFHHPANETLQVLASHEGFMFHKLLPKDGEAANVGSPLTKTFLNLSYAWDGMLTSPGDDARGALDSNTQRSC